MKYSIIIPVYNRPDEVGELLKSLAGQLSKDFEVLVIEDGSSLPCKEVVSSTYADGWDLHYYAKGNSGPGASRNYGAARARGEYLLFLDSDCVLPPGYIDAVDRALGKTAADAFGGPDRADKGFTPVQKAINYAMTSFFTTGGIRGGKKKLDKFYPRSFNFGVRRSVFEHVGGFSDMRFGEDIDLSIRLFANGYKCCLFPDAWVWHKRRTDFKKFFKQVHNSGIARINLWKRHPGSLKIVHLLPATFTCGEFVFISGMMVCRWAILPLVAYALMILADASLKEKSLKTGCLAVAASFVQLTGYGTGFLRAWWRRCICKEDEFEAFKNNFYK
ncbi:MAG TPA: glycosyl transferase family 2 [Prevotellaceae bacterium]|nr:glycosyl transferase family 2 [Prevotellaceae bacterium]